MRASVRPPRPIITSGRFEWLALLLLTGGACSYGELGPHNDNPNPWVDPTDCTSGVTSVTLSSHNDGTAVGRAFVVSGTITGPSSEPAGGCSFSVTHPVSDSGVLAVTDWLAGGSHRLGYLIVGRAVGQAVLTVRAGTKQDSIRVVVVQPDSGFRVVVAGGAGSCGVGGDLVTYCWGGVTGSTVPVRTSAGQLLQKLSVGPTLACGLDADGAAWCWSPHRPVHTLPGRWQFAAVDVSGETFACGLVLATDRLLSCWGRNDLGQLGTTSVSPTQSTDSPAFVDGGRHYLRFASGLAHTCALANDSIAYCWGRNDRGALGAGAGVDSCAVGTGSVPCARVPVPVATALRPWAIAAGGDQTCVLAGPGSAFCWGANTSGQTGAGDVSESAGVRPVAGGLLFTRLSVGRRHACGVAPDGTAWCWGANASGQLGDGTTANRSAPVAVAGGLLFDDVAAGTAHSCGIAQHIIYCWGAGGQLGDGTTSPSLLPRRVAGQPQLVR